MLLLVTAGVEIQAPAIPVVVAFESKLRIWSALPMVTLRTEDVAPE